MTKSSSDAVEEYKVGALADLISGEGKKSGSLEKLFTTDKKQKEPTRFHVAVSKKRKVHESKKSFVKTVTNKNITKAGQRKLSKKESVFDAEEDDDGDEKLVGKKLSSALAYENDAKKRRLAHADPDVDGRTVFVGNLPTAAFRKTRQVKALFSRFGHVEAVRLRGAARPDSVTTKRLAVIKGQFHKDRTNINAYVRFSSAEAAEKSLEMNGTEVPASKDESSGHRYTIRVDRVTKKDEEGPSSNNRKAVFVGNLDFGMEENALRKHFEDCGQITHVRIVRDSSGIGKGFGYVNFESEDGVELAMSAKTGTHLNGRQLRLERWSKGAKKKVAMVEVTTKKNSRGPAKVTTLKKKRKEAEFVGKKYDKNTAPKHKKPEGKRRKSILTYP